MNRYIVCHVVTGVRIGRRHATFALALRAAKRCSWSEDDYSRVVRWCDDTGKPKVDLASVWRGMVTRTEFADMHEKAA